MKFQKNNNLKIYAFHFASLCIGFQIAVLIFLITASEHHTQIIYTVNDILYIDYTSKTIESEIGAIYTTPSDISFNDFVENITVDNSYPKPEYYNWDLSKAHIWRDPNNDNNIGLVINEGDSIFKFKFEDCGINDNHIIYKYYSSNH